MMDNKMMRVWMLSFRPPRQKNHLVVHYLVNTPFFRKSFAREVLYNTGSWLQEARRPMVRCEFIFKNPGREAIFCLSIFTLNHSCLPDFADKSVCATNQNKAMLFLKIL